MFIRSERLFLRPGWPEDWQELLGLIDEGVVRNLARAPWPYTAEDARQFAGGTECPPAPRFFITLPSPSGSRVVGACGLERDEDEVELGYWIGRDYWGRGFATEAAGALLGLARTLGYRRIVASHFVDNPASRGVLRKVGFRPTGTVRPRFSRGRGETAAAIEYAVELADGCDRDRPDGTVRRAA